MKPPTRSHLGVAPIATETLTRDRSVHPKTVRCPQCGAEVDQPCTGIKGGNSHQRRRRMAVRAMHQAGTFTTTESVIPSARQIHAARKAAGLSQDELGAIIGVSGRSISGWETGGRPTGDAAAKLSEWFNQVRSMERPKVLTEPAPPVVVPPEPRDRSQPTRLDVGSSCRQCGKWLPGERSMCGRCFVTQTRKASS